MSVSATDATGAMQTSTGATSASSKSKTLDYNSFLKLLVAQLQNQDPTNPSDPTAFVSQLASFSAVEQQVNANSKLDALLTQSAFSQAASLVGKTVTSADGVTTGKIASVQVSSSGLTATLTGGQTLALGEGVEIS
jgi:flagellar basal-body rod modification protein FlgD